MGIIPWPVHAIFGFNSVYQVKLWLLTSHDDDRAGLALV